MSTVTPVLRYADDLLVRAAHQLTAGSRQSASNLVARSCRRIVPILDTSLTSGLPNAEGRIVLENSIELLKSAHTSIGTGAIDDALKAIGTASFGIRTQLPGAL